MNLGDRMKAYERCWDFSLPKRMPLIVRVDGRKFSTLTKNLKKPFDRDFIDVMSYTMLRSFEDFDTCVFAWCASDEISFLFNNYKTLRTEAWLGNRVNKLVSLTAAVVTNYFNYYWSGQRSKKPMFDSRAFVLSKEEVCNYFIWRQRDWEKNSVQMLGRSLFSHKELMHKKTDQIETMIYDHESDAKWSALAIPFKRGKACYKQTNPATGKSWTALDSKIPIFSEDRNFIEQWLKEDEE